MDIEKMTPEQLYHVWAEAKQAESDATALRREVEDQLSKKWNVPENLEGANTWYDGEYKITVTGRINRKVDGTKLHAIAVENGLEAHLDSLFRWKPEINAKAWKSAAPEITAPFGEAITAKTGRASIKIEKKAE